MSHKMSNAERAVQRKIDRGVRLGGDDRRVVQARLSSLQKRGQWNNARAIPGRALSKSVGLLAEDVAQAVHATGKQLDASKCPIMPTLAGQIEACRVSIENGGSGAFSDTFQSDSGLNTTWHVSGSLRMEGCTAQSSGTGVAGQNTGGGTNQTGASGGQSASGWGVSGQGGASQQTGVSVSVPVSGAQVSAGQNQGASVGVGGGYSSGQGQSAGGTNGQSTGVGANVSGNVMRETYFARLRATYTVSYEAAGGWQSFWGQGSNQQSGSCDAGEVQFTIEEAV